MVPQITFIQNYTVNHFQPAILKCRATGIPTPYINWYRNGDLLNEALGSRISLSDPVVTQPAISNGNARMPNVIQIFELFVIGILLGIIAICVGSYYMSLNILLGITA